MGELKKKLKKAKLLLAHTALQSALLEGLFEGTVHSSKWRLFKA